MVSQTKIRKVFIILDIFRKASPFSRVQINTVVYIVAVIICTLENRLTVRNISSIIYIIEGGKYLNMSV